MIRGDRRQINFKIVVVILALLLLVVLVLIKRDPLGFVLSPLKVFSKLSGEASLVEKEGYTHILLVGLDRRMTDMTPGGLNDTLVVASISPEKQRIVLTTIPRDLWVPMSGDYQGKINSAFGYGGIEEVINVVRGILGIPIHYYVSVDFKGFKMGVDILGGLDVYVEQSFDDYKFPIEGKEDAPEEADRYEHIHFDRGWQHMDGETALRFARSRNAVGPEGSDFARSERQKKVLLAAKEKALSASTLFNPVKLKELYELFGATVGTDITISEVQSLYQLVREIPNENILSVTVDHTSSSGQRFLYTPQDLMPYDGAWVLVPTVGDFSEIQEYLKQLLFTEYSN